MQAAHSLSTPVAPVMPDAPDPIAAARWQRRRLPVSPWLHEEVARRMVQRLDVILLRPARWLHWAPLHGGRAAHALVQAHYPQAQAQAVEPTTHAAPALLQQALAQPQWPLAEQPARTGWLAKARQRLGNAPHTQTGMPAAASVDMLWANMALHHSADVPALLAQWRSLLAVGGFVMFSTLGPDSLGELRALYQRHGWAPPHHPFTDMHDWGDRLVQAGFADPVLDVERITLTFASSERALQELRGLGRNLSPQRDTRTRGRAWLAQLHQALQACTDSSGHIALRFEVIYGHAIQPAPRVQAETAIGLQDMRQMLQRAPM